MLLMLVPVPALVLMLMMAMPMRQSDRGPARTLQGPQAVQRLRR